MLQKEALIGSISGIRVCRRALEITSLLFADDSLLFFRATAEQAGRIKRALSIYCRGIGQMINYDKCSILFNEKLDPVVMEEVRRELSVNIAAFEAKYLGLPTAEGRMKAEKFQAITDRLVKRCVVGMRGVFRQEEKGCSLSQWLRLFQSMS